MYDDLIKHDVIARARASLDAVIARRPLAVAALKAARDEGSPVESRIHAAIGGNGDDIHAAQAAWDVALRRLETAEKMGPAIEVNIRLANIDYSKQVGIAHQPVADDGFDKVKEACRRADAARAELEAATAQFHDAAAQVHYAKSQGAWTTREAFNGPSPKHTKPDGVFAVPTHAEMLARLAERT